MRLAKILLIVSLAALTGCGMIIGQMMVAGTGVKRAEVVGGDLREFQRGARTAILSPFATTEKSYHIARGDDEARLGEELSRRGVIAPLYTFLPNPGQAEKTLGELKGKSPAEVKEKLGLEEEPRYLLSGVILYRDTVVAPMHGVVMEVSYRLLLEDLENGKTAVIEIEVKDLFRDALPHAADAIDNLIREKQKG
jgi:hypothetical protein